MDRDVAMTRQDAVLMRCCPDSSASARPFGRVQAGRWSSTAVNCCVVPHGVWWSSPLVETSR